MALATTLSSCGGGGSGTGGGGGGGGGGGESIVLSPTSQMISDTTGTGSLGFNVYGQFSQQAQVFVDGQPSASTAWQNPTTLFAVVNVTYKTFLGTHQFTVHDGTKVSNAAAFTLYTPQQGPLVMQAIPGYFVGIESNPIYVATGDVNGDGYADVILPGPVDNQGSLAILYGQSDGSLALPQYLPGVTPQSVAIGDVDGNGTADLVTITGANPSGIALSILLGDGHGNFQPVSGQQTFNGNYPGTPYLADLDGDGKPDVVLSVQAPGGVHNILIWFKNQGGGNFAAPVVLTSNAAGDNTGIAVADITGDARPDILYLISSPSPSGEVIHTLVNQGNGQFVDKLTAGLNGVTGVFNVLDFNLDNKPDLVVQVPASGGVTVYAFAGNGDGSFTQAASTKVTPPFAYESLQFVAGDFDHDGFPDLAGVDGFATEPSQILYLFGDGRGNFTPASVVGPQGFHIAVSDINGDGLPDVIVPDGANFVSVALGRNDRNFPSLLPLQPATSAPPSTGDINGDGLPEIFIGGDSFTLVPGTVFLNQGNGAFQAAANTDPDSYMLADLTGKGVVDLIGGSNANSLEIWPNNGALGFAGSPIQVPPPLMGYFTVADMDHDGHPDIVALGEVLYGNGAYQFTPVSTPDLFATYAIGDFNGDGRLDIASDTFVFLNNGNHSFNAVNAGTGAPNLSQGSTPIVADFNGDGYDDIAIAWPMTSGVFIYYSRGDGTFYLGAILDTGQLVGGLPGAWSIVGGDFDGDGHPDIAVGLWISQQLVVFFNDGKGEFSRSFFASGASSIGMASSDLVHKGKPDLVIANYNVNYFPPNVNVMLHK